MKRAISAAGAALVVGMLAPSCGDECSEDPSATFCDGDRIRACSTATCDQIWCDSNDKDNVRRTVRVCSEGTTCRERPLPEACAGRSCAVTATCVSEGIDASCAARPLGADAARLVANVDAHVLSNGRAIVNDANGAAVVTLAPDGTTTVVARLGTTVDTWATGDFDGDGFVDIATSAREIFFSDGAGGFERTFVPARALGGAYQIADVDGDGLSDVVTTRGIVFGGGRAATSSWASQSHPPAGHEVLNVLVGDVDGDGLLDVVDAGFPLGVREGSGTPRAIELRVLRNEGTRRFVESHRVSVPWSGLSTTHAALAIADVTGDGRADVVLARERMVAVLRGEPSGRLSPASSLSLPISSSGKIALVDLDGDRVRDIAMGSSHPDGVVLTTKARSDGTIEPVRALDPTRRPVTFVGALTAEGGLVVREERAGRGRAEDAAVFVATGRCL